LLQAARSLGVDIDSVCGGRGLCGRCQVLLAEGDFAKHGVRSRAENLSPFGAVEKAYCRQQPMAAGRRLSCSAQVLGDVVIDVPSDSQVHRQVVRKAAEAHDIELDPVVRLHYVEVQEPDMHDPSGDLRRLEEALDFEWRLTGLACDVRVLQQLQPALRKGGWKVTVAVHGGTQIIAVWPGFRERVYGIAIDVGSTTIAAHLCDLSSGEVVAAAGTMNPQIRFGEDLMSRVSWVMMNPGGEKDLTDTVRVAINDLAAEVARQAGIAREDILEATFVGNPIMHHLLLGISPVELGGAPFALATDSALTLWATEIDFAIHRNARIYVLPCIAGHVGADAAGVVLAERPDLSDALTLLVDIGTNAEIVLGNRQPAAGVLEPHGPGVRRCADQLRAARRTRGDRACARRSAHARAAVQGHRLRSLVERAGLRGSHRRDRRHRHLRLGHHRSDRRALSRRRDPAGRHHRRRARGTQSSEYMRMAGPALTCFAARTAARRFASRRTTCARSSSRRRRCTRACGF
jgi:uncharacterized 2Fe-2S/4Fe-4S cluster protein (DUF4445 family)